MAPTADPTYAVHPSVAHLQAVLANFKAKTGRSLPEWVDLAQAEGPAGATALAAWLRTHGLGTHQAMLVVRRATGIPGLPFDDTPEGYLTAAPGYVDRQYAGKRAAFRPLFEEVVKAVRALGRDVKVCPCETMVPFYRGHVFAEVKPFASRLDLGLALGDPATVENPGGRLQDTGGFARKDRITHKMGLIRPEDLEAALPWLERAYARGASRIRG